eukprot:scaffold31093_cov80-Attheya_sp.AAC.3
MKKTYSPISHTRDVPQQPLPEPRIQCPKPVARMPQFSELIHPTHRKTEMRKKTTNSTVSLKAPGSAKQYNSYSITHNSPKSRKLLQPLYPQPAPSPLLHRQPESPLTKH